MLFSRGNTLSCTSVKVSTLPARCPPISSVAIRIQALLPGLSTALGSARTYAVDSTKLDLTQLDAKWRKRWALLPPTDESKDLDKKSKYILPMFPYPSGHLHLGHLRVYAIADVIARFHTLQGYHVMLPMGWDAFGLPAENAAIERGIDPAKWTRDNMGKMKEQLEAMNGSWDWSREIATCDPAFYKHTQKVFLLLHERGLAYQAEAEVNYDPVDKTVLANEQVDANGRSWRSGARVEKRQLKQWFLRISDFRDVLLQDLDTLAKDDAWPERVLSMQRNWLGKSAGVVVQFPIMAFDQNTGGHIDVFTTRPDTLFGVQYLALATNHPVVTKLAENDAELQAFLDTMPGLPHDSKVGYLLPHLRAVNPLAYHDNTPDPVKKSIPVYVAPYVLGNYGESAVMGVPGHDVRDHAFWKGHNSEEPVKFVLAASADEAMTTTPIEPFVDQGFMTNLSGPFKGKPSEEVGQMLVRMLSEARLAKHVEKWRLRDWLISRQRYWGTPIPIVHCTACGEVPVPDDQLPVELPKVDEHWFVGKAGNPLEAFDEWIDTSCPKCGGAAKRDTDTMDTFVDSSWYYMRFIDPHNKAVPFAADKATSLLPVDLYIGGVEHAILHLLYARFVYKFLMNSSLVAPKRGEEAQRPKIHEPFSRLITQGMVHGKTYTDLSTGRFLKAEELDLSNPNDPKTRETGAPVVHSFEKMSKSKHNGVSPTALIASHGADAMRAHMLFQAPVSEVLYWDERKMAGVTRWMNRVYDSVRRYAAEVPREEEGTPEAVEQTLQERFAGTKPGDTDARACWDADAELWLAVRHCVKSVTSAYNKVYVLNTAVSDLMTLANKIGSTAAGAKVKKAALDTLVRLAAPITPAFAEECWALLRPKTAKNSSIFRTAQFPLLDDAASSPCSSSSTQGHFGGAPTRQKTAVQVNGRLRFVVETPVPPEDMQEKEADAFVEAEVLAKVLKTEKGRRILGGHTAVEKVVRQAHVIHGGKLVNFVIGG